MYPRTFAKTTPDKPAAIIAGTGESLSFLEMEKAANQVAHLFRELGVQAGERVAFVLENTLDVYPFVWGAQRSGLLFVPVSCKLTGPEIAYILNDSDAKVVLTSDVIGDEALEHIREACPNAKRFKTGVAKPGWSEWAQALEPKSTEPIENETAGVQMYYSSGTTGRPKGIVRDHAPGQEIEKSNRLPGFLTQIFGMTDQSVYLIPAPLYHAAPLSWGIAAMSIGASVVIMKKFDPAKCLEYIEEYGVTAAQFVPTHFIRMLKLPEEVRSSYDVSKMQMAVHAAAPCPVPIKQAMIDWWGEVIYEYYSGSEGVGMTLIKSEEWLTHKGSVGRPLYGAVHICDENGSELPIGEEGLIFFSGGVDFSYHKDEAKTKDSYNENGWASMGDIGRVDEEGYLYLTDRKSFMIISGGVNIYPQEIENHLVTHPKIQDAAVIGAPDPDFGERVVAVVQPSDWSDANDSFAAELEAYCREELSGVKIPRQIDFRQQLPRTDTGKLLKRHLRDEYWKDQ